MSTVERVPTQWEVLDERFRAVRGDHVVQRLFDGGRWLEGPAYSPAWRCLLFSDIPNDRVLRWDEVSGRCDVFQTPAGYANGRTLDRRGRVVTCEHGPRRVTRTEPDGSQTVVADRWRGKRFNSPNDVVETADGSLWFTDPSYGIDSDYEGHRAEPELDGCHVYRCSPDGRVDRVADDFQRPNGLAFSADERRLYIVDTQRRHLRHFDVGPDWALRDRGVLADCDAGSFDGIRLDSAGRLWVAAHDGVHCLDQDGTMLGKLRLPEICSNLTFGGRKRNVLFVTATTSVYSLALNVTGAGPTGG
ncbi:gluconolactonase [Micromonospora phaseoli]|uniref:Gluconolactonase n=1 Tax=Micromonospora phaseoli TaxID=1144548 RepID=A0A1H6Z344_9ACTN|nr:SMP-30/gluconolactonase/LRE family protein [Micromonospora phaseoli]PZW00364.1 gluconolactonase [Micromonospora phaseoli]GIJ76842.1 gluconolactonase [Micromonospora phaseoli]SEJ43970.1 gluconolactonase [Micromonospora phaseoli]